MADEVPVCRAAVEPIRADVANDEVPWDEFDPTLYWQQNYRRLRVDDRAIIDEVRDFFSRHFGRARRSERVGIDVGSGSNLYPALGMLRWCSRIVLTDRSVANVAWLRENLCAGADTCSSDQWEWTPYAQALGWSMTEDVRRLLAARSEVLHQNLFDLPVAEYDTGTMFFVAESMTSLEPEFEQGVERFVGALRPGAPFATAFMSGSTGYEVGEKVFPAVEVTTELVTEVLVALKIDPQVTRVGVPVEDPLRDGYDGMIVAVGTAPHR